MDTTTNGQPQELPGFADIIERFSPIHGQEWAASTAPTLLIARLQQACKEKNLSSLRGWLLPAHNGFSRAAFTRITGVRLPATQRAIGAVLEEFVGPERVAAHQQALAGQRQQREQAQERLKRQVASRSVRHRGETLTTDVFIQRIIAEGYSKTEERKRGAVPVYALWHAEKNSGYEFRRRCEYDYILLLLGQRQPGLPAAGEGDEHR